MSFICPYCGSDKTAKNGRTVYGRQRVLCRKCLKTSYFKTGEEIKMSNEIKNSGVISLKIIKDRFDIKAAILRELEKIERGTLISEPELALRAAGRDKYRFRRTVENNEEEFRSRRIKLRLDDTGAKWYWGWPEDIIEAQKIRDL